MSLRALIVDDNTDLQWIFAAAFQHAGFETALAHNGYAALEQIDRNIPDVMVLDINMPKCDGLEVLARIRQANKREQMYIIVVTGNAIAARYIEPESVDMIMIKPVDTLVLVRLARRLALSHRKQHGDEVSSIKTLDETSANDM